MKKLLKVSTVPESLDTFYQGQLKWLSEEYEVVALSSPGESLDKVKNREGVRTIAVPMERRISIFKDSVSLFRLIKVFAKEKPYIVHSITPKAGLLSMVAAWLTRVPVRIHTFTGLVFPTATGLKQKILILTDKIICACATYVNPEGQGVKRDLERFNITRKPLHIIANGNIRGIDFTWYDATPEVVEKAETIKKSDLLTFCFIGRLVGDKGINELISAFERLYKENSKIRLILIGSLEEHLDPLKPETMNAIKTCPGIDFVGRQSDIRPYLLASDILVFPSYREGMPNVVLEAGAMGLPTIATDINGCSEMIIPGENGVLVPSKDADALYEAMKDWLEHPEKVKYMASNSRRLVAERFEQKMIWNALREEYRKLINTQKLS